MTIDRVVVVGSSVAGIRAAQALRAGGFDGELVVVGAESAAPYDKPPLSKQLLTGESTDADIGLLRADGEFDLRLGVAAAALDPVRKEVVLADGEPVGYDTLIIATGVRARTLPGAGEKLVRPLRELKDAAALRTRLADGAPVVVIGGGFIGAEVAAAAAVAGCPVTIVEALAAPFSRVLGAGVGSLLTALHAEHGVTVLTNATVAGVNGLAGDRALVRLADGRALEAGTVVAGVGCVPNTEWLADSGLPLDDGVHTDDRCAVRAAEGVYAIGDVARWHDQAGGVTRRVEHWTNAVEQATFVAHQILRPEQSRHYSSVPYFWSDQYGVKIQMVGRVAPSDTVEVLRYTTPTGDRNVALYSRAGQFTAAVTFGWPKGSATTRLAWQRGAQVTHVRATLAKLSDRVTPLDLAQKGS
jgi:3-phenylpropionate/trans-cinnamate dioxygenase ferredoxin reductase component